MLELYIRKQRKFQRNFKWWGHCYKGSWKHSKNTAQLIWKIISFAAKHTEAAKNIMAAVGTYSVYNSLKNKINNFINKENNKSVNSYNFEGCISKISK